MRSTGSGTGGGCTGGGDGGEGGGGDLSWTQQQRVSLVSSRVAGRVMAIIKQRRRTPVEKTDINKEGEHSNEAKKNSGTIRINRMEVVQDTAALNQCETQQH